MEYGRSASERRAATERSLRRLEQRGQRGSHDTGAAGGANQATEPWPLERGLGPSLGRAVVLIWGQPQHAASERRFSHTLQERALFCLHTVLQ